MATHVAAGRLPGLVTLVACGDDVHIDAIGTPSFDDDAPLARDAIFRIASLTKPITAVATMSLVEEGLLRLEDPIDELVPRAIHGGHPTPTELALEDVPIGQRDAEAIRHIAHDAPNISGVRPPDSCNVAVAREAGRCDRRDSNPHGLPHRILSPARLPVPPRSQAARI